MSIRSIGAALRGRLAATAARMRADSRKASAMIEFAMIAPVFFLLLMGIIENGVIFFAGSTLQYATDNAARYVRTGQAQAMNPPMTEADFRNRICADAAPLVTCDGNLQVDMNAYTGGYTGNSFSNPILPDGTLNPEHNINPGTACNVVLLRVFYKWHVITPVLSQFLTNMGGGYHLVTATAAFRNEPFTSAVAGC
ncbi:MAG: TadE/TadG family type IV pilus assembly protein [Rhizomicrobium sp.]